MADRFDQEIQRIAEVLATVVRISGRTRQSLEDRMRLSSGYLSKILGGTVELRVRHILMIAEAVGLSPGDVFRVAYPQPESSGEEARRLLAGIRAALGQRGPRPEPSVNFDEEVKRSLGRLLGFSDPDAEGSA
jgi:hypothetical protein